MGENIIRLLLICISFSVIGQEKKTKNKVVFIIVDGISSDLYYKSNTPNIDAIGKEGAFTEAYVGGKRGTITETPTISAVGYNSLITGTWVNKHNVYGNNIRKPNYNYPTLFRVLKDAYPNKKTAIFSTWLDNRTKLVGENLPETNNVKVDYHFDGLEVDEKRFPHDRFKKYLKRIDAEVAREAANYILDEGPDLSWVYLEHSDDVAHYYGESKAFFDIVAYEDALVGTIADAIKLRELKTDENWLLIVTTDHGRMPLDGKHHGFQSDRERSIWIALNKPITNTYFKNNSVALVDIYPTIIDFLNIPLPKQTAYELDGIPLNKQIDVFDLAGVAIDNKVKLNWLVEHKKHEKAKVYISYTNNIKKGGTDEYKLIGEVDVQDKEYLLKIKPVKKTTYIKVVFVTKNHSINTWIKIN